MSGSSTGGSFRPSPALLAGVVLLLAYVYGTGLADYPLKWEEPRRCLVALEMLLSGDWIVPRLLGEAYTKKPPLQNWLIAAAAGFDAQRVGAVAARGVSLAAALGTALVLWVCGTDGVRPRRSILPALVFLTLGTVVQSARTAEIDPLFTFFVAAAVGCFEIGRRRGSPLLTWFVPQGFVAAGVLTKVLAPLFVYPPVLWLVWRRREALRVSLPALALGLAAMAAAVAAWAVPYAALQPGGGVGRRGLQEIATRTLHYGAAGWMRHLVTYPFQFVGWLLPWSLFAVSRRAASRRGFLDAVRRDPWLGLCAGVVLWGFLVFLAIPEQKGRYLMPVMPAAAVLIARWIERERHGAPAAGTWARLAHHPGTWVAAAAGWAALVLAAGPRLGGDRLGVLLPLLAGLAALIVPGLAAVRGPIRQAALPVLLALGLVYGVAYAGILERREARRNAPEVVSAQQVATWVQPGEDVVCALGVRLQFCLELTRSLGRPLSRRATAGALWVAPSTVQVPEIGAPLVDTGVYRAWRIDPPEAWSFDSRPLFAPRLEPEVQARRQAELERAQRELRERPGDPDAHIWVGRRLAYLGRYREAVAVFSEGIERFPDDPRFLRHRGHRWITLRRLAEAVADLELAARRIEGLPDEVEPDGLPNARNIPTSTLQSNVWYHLGLAHYLRGDLQRAERSYRRCLEVSRNPDMLSATTQWLYTTLLRAGKRSDAERLLEPIHADMEILENRGYHDLLLLHRGERTAAELLEAAGGQGSAGSATVGYGVAAKLLADGRRAEAFDLLVRVRDAGPWAAFGAIAAEADLVRMSDRTL